MGVEGNLEVEGGVEGDLGLEGNLRDECGVVELPEQVPLYGSFTVVSLVMWVDLTSPRSPWNLRFTKVWGQPLTKVVPLPLGGPADGEGPRAQPGGVEEATSSWE